MTMGTVHTPETQPDAPKEEWLAPRGYRSRFARRGVQGRASTALMGGVAELALDDEVGLDDLT